MESSTGQTFSFTKLIVDDLEAMTNYYCDVYGFHRGRRDQFDEGIGGEPIDEITLTATPDASYGSLTLLKRLAAPRVTENETILGFTTRDLDALLARVQTAGGTLASPIKNLASHGIRVAFARDPEGHLNELVELQE